MTALLPIADRVHDIADQEFAGAPVHISATDEAETVVVVEGPDAREETIAAPAAFGQPLQTSANVAATADRVLPGRRGQCRGERGRGAGFGSGEVTLGDDTIGNGHRGRVAGEIDAQLAAVQVAD